MFCGKNDRAFGSDHGKKNKEWLDYIGGRLIMGNYWLSVTFAVPFPGMG
jgi:hypothetical protein